MTTACRNVIMVGIDTLRYDHLGLSGYSRDTSPNIDVFASENTVFTKCFSQAPKTAASFTSLFTSLYPSFHGVVDNINKNGFGWRLHNSVPTLAEILKQRGFATAAFTEGGNLSNHIGLNRGFDVYETQPTNLLEGRRHPALQWLKSHKDKPLFLFFHTFAVHAPYLPPTSVKRRFEVDYRGNIPRSLEELQLSPTTFSRTMKAEKNDPQAIEHMKALYDSCIHYMDTFMGEFFETLRTLGLFENTIIVFTSDHGEEFMEHGNIYHKALYDELLHVPLIVHIPNQEQGARIDRMVRSIDIMPTILDVTGARPEGLIVQGKSLFDETELPALADLGYRASSMRTPQFKFLFEAKKGDFEIYNIVWDAEEKVNLDTHAPELRYNLFKQFQAEKTRSGALPALQEIFAFGDRASVQNIKLQKENSPPSPATSLWDH